MTARAVSLVVIIVHNYHVHRTYLYLLYRVVVSTECTYDVRDQCVGCSLQRQENSVHAQTHYISPLTAQRNALMTRSAPVARDAV